MAACLLVITGVACSSLRNDPGLVTLKATGDPDVTFRIISSVPNTPEITASVPATLQFGGRKLELRCVHGPTPGRLSLSAQRGTLRLATGDTTRPGETTVFEIRPNSIAVRALPPEP